MRKCLLAIFACVGLLFCTATPAEEMATLVLSDANEPPFTTPDRTGFLDAVAGEAFRRAGVKLRLVRSPSERALINANSGLTDGDLTRIAGLEAQYPNLIQVPEKLVDWTFTAYSKNPSVAPRWEDVRELRVGYVKGWKIYEQHLAGALKTIVVEDSAQLFRLLELDRIQVALYARWSGDVLIRKQGLGGVYPLEPPLATREMFIYVHKRHAELVPKLAAALRAIKAEGLYDRLYREKVLAAMSAPKKK